MSDEGNAETLHSVPVDRIDSAVENALWCATANAQDGYLTDRSFMDSFDSGLSRHWQILVGVFEVEERREEETPETSEQESIGSFV